MHSRFEQFSLVISSIYGSIQKIERDEMVRCGLKGAYAQYLTILNHFADGITAAELCELCDRDKAAVSRAIADMEQKGLLIREGGTAYRARLRLTDAGKDAAEFVCRRGQTAVELAGGALSEEARQSLYTSLALISDRLQTLCKQGLPQQQDLPTDKETL